MDQAASHPQTATQKIMSLTLFILVSALFYAGAMIAMKYWGKLPPLLVIGVIVICFAFGAWAEIGALQVERLAIVYVPDPRPRMHRDRSRLCTHVRRELQLEGDRRRQSHRAGHRGRLELTAAQLMHSLTDGGQREGLLLVATSERALVVQALCILHGQELLEHAGL